MREVDTPHYHIPSMVNTILETCHPSPPTPMPSKGVYTYPYMPYPVVPSPPIVQTILNLGMFFIQSLSIQSSDDQEEQERKKMEFLMQPENTKTQ